MKSLTKIALTALITFSTVIPAMAASGARADHSGILVWAFLGFCALIVVAQLVPATLMLLGIVKGVAGSKEEIAGKA